MDTTRAIEIAFQQACNDHRNAARKGNEELRRSYLNASIAIEDAYPDEIEAYRARMGFSTKASEPDTGHPDTHTAGPALP